MGSFLLTKLAHGRLWLIAVCLIAVALSDPDPLTAQSSSALESQIQSLAGEWSFKTDPYKEGTDARWWAEEHDDASWDVIKVPGVWDIYDQYSDYAGMAWYRLEFPASDAATGRQARLVFDSVYHDAEIWLNGRRLGENKLGFLAFEFDITKHLKQSGTNILAVKTDNQFKRGAVWNWGGIRRPVYIKYTPSNAIKKVYVDAIPDLEKGTAAIKVRTRVVTATQPPKNARVRIRIMRDGAQVAEQETAVSKSTQAGQYSEFNTRFALLAKDVTLWHFNDPNLYTVEATLIEGNTPVHQHSDRFGIRLARIKGEEFYFNGEPVRLVGLNTVPEDRFSGNALPLSRIKEDVDLLKSVNANFARLSGQPLPKDYLDYLDEVGFLTFEEVGVWGKDLLVDPDQPMPKEWLQRMIDERYNHPSIIGWNVGNEIGDIQKNPKVVEYVREQIKRAKAQDPTRLAVYVSNTAQRQPNDPARYSDIVMFNKYNDHETLLRDVHKYQPDKPVFYSEIGRILDSEDPNLSTVDPEILIGPLRKYPYLVGASLWTFNDYRSNWQSTSPGWSTPATENRSWGIVDIYRAKKRSFGKFQEFFAPVEQFDLSGSGRDYKLTIKPRGRDSFPSFKMNGYRLLWEASATDGTLINAGATALPTLRPNDGASTFNLKVSDGFAALSVHLIDPAGYSVLDVRQESAAPAAPTIRAVHTSIDTARVVYNRVANADEYRAVALTPDDIRLEGKPTINEFADIGELRPNVAYRFSVEALNDAGASRADDNAVKLSTDPDELPPVIWKTHAEPDAFFIGFSSDITDYRYEIQYGLEPGQYSKQHLISTRGSTRIPSIKPASRHCFRFRRHVTGSVASEWTDEHCLQLPGDQGLAAPQNAYAVLSGSALVLGIKPVESATGYRVSGAGTSVDTRLAQSPFIVISQPELVAASSLTIQTLDENGRPGKAAPVRFLGKTQ